MTFCCIPMKAALAVRKKVAETVSIFIVRGRFMGRGSAGASCRGKGSTGVRFKGMGKGQGYGKVDGQGQCWGKVEGHGQYVDSRTEFFMQHAGIRE